jgi:pimeloyl-ACP methyl ester carboxylesterase
MNTTTVAPSLIAAGIAFMLPLAMASPAAGQATVTDRPVMTTTALDVDGLSMRVRAAALAGRKPGQVAVLFESRGSTPLETWDPVLSAVATFAPVVAYDRAGTGQSTWDSLPPTPERVAARLRRLLDVLGVPPPYVLVGHSWGGVLIRYFGGSFPRDISGMVYIDPTDFIPEPGTPPVFPPSGLPFDTKRYAEAVQQRRLQHLRGWVLGRGEFVVAANAGHLVHAEDPALVVEAIRRVVQTR